MRQYGQGPGVKNLTTTLIINDLKEDIERPKLLLFDGHQIRGGNHFSAMLSYTVTSQRKRDGQFERANHQACQFRSELYRSRDGRSA